MLSFTLSVTASSILIPSSKVTGSGRDIADPWYTGDFDETYRDVEEGSEGFLNYLREKGKI